MYPLVPLIINLIKNHKNSNDVREGTKKTYLYNMNLFFNYLIDNNKLTFSEKHLTEGDRESKNTYLKKKISKIND